MLLVSFYLLVALAFGGYTTYLLATALPQALLDRASRHGRFAGLHDDARTDVSDTKSGTRTPTPKISDRNQNASGC